MNTRNIIKAGAGRFGSRGLAAALVVLALLGLGLPEGPRPGPDGAVVAPAAGDGPGKWVGLLPPGWAGSR